MNSEPSLTPLARLAQRPVPVLVGVVVGFLGCCLAGRLAAQQQPFENFVRFHQGIAPDSHFYPPFSQVLNLARSRVHPDKVLVVVGGNSILHGAGQRESQIWTNHLQALLGEDYVVLNLALRGNDPFEFGGLVAERLAAEGVPVIFVTAALDGNIDIGAEGAWEGRIYQYFFWDAWGKGLLPPDEERNRWLENESFLKDRRTSQRQESRYRGLVEGLVYAGDLWNTVAYRYLGSVWSPLKYDQFWKAHRNISDADPGSNVPFERYNREEEVPHAHRIMQAWIHSPAADALLKGDCDERVAAPFHKFLPSALYDRTLLVFRLEGVYFLDRLPPDERARYRTVAHRLPQAIAGGGLQVQLLGEDYSMRDYFDRSHFSEQGGRRVAADLAPTIRSMAARLYGINNADHPGEKP